MSRYDRQMILPQIGSAGQARLGAAHVLIVGAGGLGASLIPALAGAGVGRIAIVDDDLVEESNLHRQTLFRMGDLGRPKAGCAAEAARGLNPEIRVDALALHLDPDNLPPLLAGVDLVIDAADSFAVSYMLSDACGPRGVPLISASVLGRQGYAGGFCGHAPGLRAVFPDLPETAASCATAGVMGPVVAMLGAMQAQMALSVLLGLTPSPLGQIVNLDLANWRCSGFRFDGAAEPEAQSQLRFIGRGQLMDADCVIELRGTNEAPQPVTSRAMRIAPRAIGDWQPPAGQRVVLACRSGLRAWRAGRALQARGVSDLALIATG